MKTVIVINQHAIVSMGLDFDIKDAAILSAIMDLPRDTFNLKRLGNENYHWVHHKLISNEVPMLGIKGGAIMIRIKKMCGKGLLKMHPDNKKLSRTYIAITAKAKLLAEDTQNN